MTTTDHVRAWTKGDPVSRALLDIVSGQGLGSDVPITAGAVELAHRHGLIAILSDHCTDPLIRAVLAREESRRQVLEEHLTRILERFHEAGIRASVLKGPAMAERYANPKHRPFSDIDLLVEAGQLDTALATLTADPLNGVLPHKRPKADKRDIVFEGVSGVRFNVDVHWDLFSYSQLRGSAAGATEAAWSAAWERPDSPWGLVWEIPDAYRLAFLATHSVLDHRFRLILFRDFLEFTRHPVDWGELEELSSRWGLRSTTHLALWMSKAMLGADVPGEFLAAIRPSSAPLRYLEFALPRTDVVRFSGHRAHPINLAAVLLNDSALDRLVLLSRAPLALPRWRRRVTEAASPADLPRTLIVVSTDRRRGAEVFTERLRDGLLHKGWVVEAVALHGTGAVPGADVEVLTRHDERRRFDIGVLQAVRRRIRSFKPDVLVANGGATLRYCSIAKLGLGCRLVYIAIGEPQYWIRSRPSHWANRLLLRGTDLVLAVSERTRQQLIEFEPRIEGRVMTAHTGIPDGLFRVEQSEPTGRLRVLMVGSLTEEKDPVRALRIVAQVDGAMLRFVGDGPLRNALEIESGILDMRDRVEFAGAVADVQPHLEWAHVLILTSRSEGLPGAVLEAGAAGVPTATLDVGGVREAVIHEESGFVAHGDPELVDVLKDLDRDRALLKRMGTAAREHISSRFQIDDIVDRYSELLTDVWR